MNTLVRERVYTFPDVVDFGRLKLSDLRGSPAPGTQTLMIYQTKGKTISNKPITLASNPGNDLEILGSEGTHYRARLVWVETRLYQIMVVTPGKPRPDANVFFESFQITGKP